MFYINVDTRKFIAAPSSDSHRPPHPKPPCNCNKERPTFLNYGKCKPSPAIEKPQLVQFQISQIPVTFLHEDGTPLDLTGAELLLAVDNNFKHSDSLIALDPQGVVTDAQAGEASFAVVTDSMKLHKLVQAKIPASQVMMQIIMYPQGSPWGKMLLHDNGINLIPRMYSDNESPRETPQNYYTKTQMRSILKNYQKVDSDSSTGMIINGEGVPGTDIGMPGDFYVDTLQSKLYFKKTDEWVFIGYLSTGLPQIEYDVIQ